MFYSFLVDGNLICITNLLYSNPTQYQYKYLSCLIIVCICHVGVGDTTIISLHSDISKKQYYNNRIVVAKLIIPH